MNKKISDRGFVALSTVMVVGFMVSTLALLSVPKLWQQGVRVIDLRDRAEAKLNALSCVQIFRLDFLTQYRREVQPKEIEEFVGQYSLPNGSCEIENLERVQSKVKIKTSSTKNQQKIVLNSEIDVSDEENRVLFVRE